MTKAVQGLATQSFQSNFHPFQFFSMCKEKSTEKEEDFSEEKTYFYFPIVIATILD